MTFSEQPFETRFTAMGDEAEGVFEKVWPQKFVRYGLDRPPIKVNGLPAFIRYTPDYLTNTKLVEVQGFGSDNTVKFKIDKIEELEEWNRKLPVEFFLYHRPSNKWTSISLRDLLPLLSKHGHYDKFADGNQYFAMHKRFITTKWVDVE